MANPAGEALLAVVGVNAFLEPGPLRLTAPVRQEAMKLPQAIRKEVRRFLTAQEWDPARPLPDFRYRAALEAITEPKDVAHLEEKLAGTDDEAGLALSAAAGAALEYLRSVLPRRTRVTATGATPVPPSGEEVARFRRIHAVAQRPLHALEELNEGALGRDQVRALEAIYPSLYEVVKLAVFDVLAEIKAKRPRFELSRRRDKQLQVILQAASWNPRLAADLQRHWRERDETDPQQQAGGPMGTQLKLSPDTHQTPVRRVEQR